MARYVVVDTATKKILGGPFAWDGESEWTPPVAGTLMPEAEALGSGYTFVAAAPDPAEILRSKIPLAIASNNQFLALGSPTNAQILQQVVRMTRQLNALGRLTVQMLDETSDA